MKLPPTVKWIVLALLGLVIAVGVAFASTNLVSQQIGISSESIRAGDALAPVGGAKGQRPPHEQQGSTPTTSGEETKATAPATGSEPPTTVPTEPERGGSHDDSGGSGDNGGGADD